MKKSAAGWIKELPPVVAALSAGAASLLSAVLIWQVGGVPVLPALILFALFGVLLAVIDGRTQLLPNVLLLPFGLGALVLLTAASALTGEWHQLMGGLIGAAGMFAVYLILALIAPGNLGMGDVKLSAILGLYGGYLGINAWLLTLMGGFVLGGVVSILLLALTKASARSAFPFGPPMLAASLLAVLIHA